MEITDREIVEKLIERDPIVTDWFYYRKCRPLFLSLMKRLFSYPIEYNEFVNEVILFLMENGEHRLRSFDFQSTLLHWLRVCLVRHFVRNNAVMIDDTSKEAPYLAERTVSDSVRQIHSKLDLDILLNILAADNPRHAYVLRRILVDDAEPEAVAAEIRVQVANLYNIKKRAYANLAKIASGIKRNRL